MLQMEQQKTRPLRQVRPTSTSGIQSPSYVHEAEIEGFLRDVIPVAVTLKYLGVLPFSFIPTGGAKLVIISPIILYTLLLQTVMFVAGSLIFYERIRWLNHSQQQFSTFMIEITYLVSITPLFLSPFVQLPELKKRASFFEKWNHMQVFYREITGKALEVGMQRQCKVMMICMIIISTIVCSFPYVMSERKELIWQAIPFGYSLFLTCMLSAIWILNATALQRVAKIMAEEIEQEFMRKKLDRVEEFRILWLDLCALTRHTGDAMGFTYGTHTLVYFVEQVLAVYSLLNNAHHILSVNTVVFIGAAVIFSGLTFIICNVAQGATEEVGPNFQDKLQRLSYKISSERKETVQDVDYCIFTTVRAFVETIVENPPTISFSGFVEVNRGLQKSFMSAMVTYLVVLIQFQMSTKEDEKASVSSMTTIPATSC